MIHIVSGFQFFTPLSMFSCQNPLWHSDKNPIFFFFNCNVVINFFPCQKPILVQKTNFILSYIIYTVSSLLLIFPFLLKCPDLQIKEEMETMSPEPFSFLSWASELQSHYFIYIYVCVYVCIYIYTLHFFPPILFMARWIRNNKYQLVDLISLVRSDIWYLL